MRMSCKELLQLMEIKVSECLKTKMTEGNK